MKTSRDILKSVLGEFFRDNFYRDAVRKLRDGLKEKKDYRDNWEGVIKLILNRELEKGEALSLVLNTANLSLDENSDEEAYKWLTLMLINSLGEGNTLIVEY